MKQEKSYTMDTLVQRSGLLTAVCLLACFISFSQPVAIGIRGGVNLSNWNITGVQDVNPSSILGPEAAFIAEFKVKRSFSIQPELSYGSYGSKLNYSAESITFRTSYLQIPVLAKYYLPNGISFFAGPQIGFLLTAKGKTSSGDKQELKNTLKKNDFFVVGGIEYNFPIGIAIGARYNAGLKNIYNVSGQDAEINNSAFGFSVTYKFSAGHW